MQLKIPFGSSWEFLRAAPERWEFSIPAPRAGASARSAKLEQTLGTRGAACLLWPQKIKKERFILPNLAFK